MRRTQFAVAVVGLLFLLLTGCVENRSSVLILQNAVPGDDCTMSDTTSEYRTMGTLELSEVAFSCNYNPQYFMYPVITNALLPTGEVGATVEQNYIEIVEARVDLDLGSLGGSFEDLKYRYPAFKLLAPGETATLQVLVIPPQIAELLAGTVRASGQQPIIRVKLKFLYQHGGLEHETHQIDYPIQLCDGCLIKEITTCDSGEVGGDWPQGNSCNPTQDDLLYCCSSGGACPVCPAIDTSTQTE